MPEGGTIIPPPPHTPHTLTHFRLSTLHNIHIIILFNPSPPHTQPVGQALIYALGRVCQEKFTVEAHVAWVALYTAIQHYMTLGMTEGLDA